MGFKIVRGPFILLETVEMLYKFVNGISFRFLLSQRKPADDTGEGSVLMRRIEQLQEIMEETCQGVDRNDPDLRRYFGNANADAVDVGPCLARALTYSFCPLSKPGFQESVDEIRGVWKRMQEGGVWLRSYDAAMLNFSCDEGSPGDLFEQIRALKLPGDYRVELYAALRDFDNSLQELAELIRPVARRLEETICKADWILDDMEAYWRQSPVTPLEFATKDMGPDSILKVGENTVVAIALMNCNMIVCNMAKAPSNFAGHNYVFMGCGITTASLFRERDLTLELVSATLKVISDKKRLEILRRLSKERSYGMELAESMGMNQGNISRSLALLHSCGFIHQKRETLRTYYQADRKAFHNFLEQLERTVFE